MDTVGGQHRHTRIELDQQRCADRKKSKPNRIEIELLIKKSKSIEIDKAEGIVTSLLKTQLRKVAMSRHLRRPTTIQSLYWLAA